MKRFIAGLAVSASMLLAMVPNAANAVGRTQVTETYYYDSTYTVQLGYRIIYCDGSVYSEGQVTRYRETYYTDWCPGGALTGEQSSSSEAAQSSSLASFAR
jgi:hypothetical protein